WSARSPFSIRESPTAGCQAQWLLKSRRIVQTCSIGASMIAERVTLIISKASLRWLGRAESAQLALQVVEGRLEHALADLLGERLFAALGCVELGPPFGEGQVAVGDRRELQRGNVVLDTHRTFEDRVRALEVVVGQREQLLADRAAVLQAEVAHAAHPVRRQVVLD